jgi:hypothetical protein
MRHAVASVSFLVLCAALLAPMPASAQAASVYRERTGTQEVRIEIGERALPEGSLLEASMSSGESYRIESDASGAVTTCSFAFPPDGTAWRARREGTTLRLEGTVRDRPVSRTISIDEHPWYESAERSLQPYAISGSTEPVRFWMIQPYDGRAHLMAGRIDRREPVEVNGRTVEAVRVTVRPAGILAFTWSSVYWFDPLDGTFLRSRCVRGFLSLVPTVMELVEDRRPGR